MKKFFVGMMVSLLVACAPISKKPTETPELRWQQRQHKIAQLEKWLFYGRTAIKQPEDGFNANIRWEQRGETYSIKLTGPFSQGQVVLAGNNESVALTLDDGETLTASSPEKLLDDALGWHLPVSALHDWVRGVPYSGLPIDKQSLDEIGRLTHLQQADWDIRYIRYAPFAGVSMPGKVFIKHPKLGIRLIVSKWSSLP